MSRSREVARALTLAALLSCVSWSLPASADDDAFRPARDALIIGSSSVHQAFGRLIDRELRDLGYRVKRHGVTSAGLARPDYRDMSSIVEGLPVKPRSTVVFVYLGMNDAQSIWLRRHERTSRRPWLGWNNARWSTVYERRARRFFERLCARGARDVVALLPVDVKRPRLQRRLARVRRLQAKAAAATSCARAISTSGDMGRFHLGGVARRYRDGVHMTRAGARAVWRRIRGEALSIASAEQPAAAQASAMVP